MTEKELEEQAFKWIKNNQKNLIETFASSKDYIADQNPVALFMAGSPGAGKTETSIRLIEQFRQKPVRIDADEIRKICPGYTGENAHIFQKAATKGVHILYDHILHHGLNVTLDGTFGYSDALKNISRALEYNRKVIIYFIYQNPKQAWDFTQKREAIEKRKVSKQIFIETFTKSRINANQAKKQFGEKIELNLIIKDFEKDLDKLELNITNIDDFLETLYDNNLLETLL